MRRIIRSALLVLIVVGAGAAQATAATPPPSLAGETLSGTGTMTYTCTNGSQAIPGHGTFSITGTASGPYPGTFEASGAYDIDASFRVTLSEEFSISSGGTEITGTKTTTNVFPNLAVAGCTDTSVRLTAALPTYDATIRPDTGGAFRDSGRAGVTWNGRPGSFAGLPTNGFLQNFTTSNGVVQIEPATKDECKDGGYEQFGYENQGQCIKDFNEREHNG